MALDDEVGGGSDDDGSEGGQEGRDEDVVRDVEAWTRREGRVV